VPSILLIFKGGLAEGECYLDTYWDGILCGYSGRNESRNENSGLLVGLSCQKGGV
jgi:hypothetical protein